ncbi:hypothetical protein L6E12_33825 [Actinokineospora sp. PR83]|uniref:hypothetical protein n=1 Tax=Actinokineospora sp. PR83 TaxID=2884908 RepID=UPI001F182F47|nr:hypothetical protein [Actinokineospora sp. PR83]MCG8920748.1 hypothetical protein [Actinokineospora sp. PR83]
MSDVGFSADAELLVARDVDDGLEQWGVDTFSGYGCAVESRRELAHRGPSDLEWLVLAALPLQAFLTGLGTEAVKDIYTGVKRLAGRRPGARASAAPLGLQDSASGVRVVLEDDLTAEAYKALATVDLSAFRHGPVHYDRHRKAWRSELDEAAG